MYKTSVPPELRKYSNRSRMILAPFEDQIVLVTGSVRDVKEHPTRNDLKTVLLANLRISPVPSTGKDHVVLNHMWFLLKQIRKASPQAKFSLGEKLEFAGTVYAYCRLGGRSKEKGLIETHDFGILPIKANDKTKRSTSTTSQNRSGKLG